MGLNFILTLFFLSFLVYHELYKAITTTCVEIQYIYDLCNLYEMTLDASQLKSRQWDDKSVIF